MIHLNADRVLEMLHHPIQAGDVVERRRAEAAVSAVLDATDREASEVAGRAMTLDEAIAYAFEGRITEPD